MKVLSLFSGIGAFEKSLQRLEIECNLVGFSEIDKYAVKSYCAIHGVDESLNLGDITKIDAKTLPKDIDLITYGFPCQDISLAGKQKGLLNEDGTQTRSGLFFEALRIIEETQPKVAIAENVKNLTSKKFNAQFQVVLASLEAAGYNNYWEVLNAKDFGIPQNRERVFIVSIRKDIDTGFFQFPEGFPLELRLKDILEDEVDEKYYLKKSLNIVPKENYLQWDNSGKGYNSQQDRAYYQDGLCPTLSCCNNNGDKSQIVLMDKAKIFRVDIPQTVKVRKYPVDTKRLCEVLRKAKDNVGETAYGIAEVLHLSQDKVAHWFRQDDCFAIPDPEIWMDLKKLLEIETDEFDTSIMTFEEKEGVYEKSERHYFEDGISPTLTSTTAAEKIIVREATKKGFAEAVEGDSINLEQPNSKTRRGRVGKQVAQTLTTSPQQGVVLNCEPKIDVIGNYSPSGHDASRIVNPDGLAPTVKENHGTVTAIVQDLCIRKLTPKECWRLMDFDDEDFEKAEAVNSNTQLYKQAGNSIVVAVSTAIIKALIEANIFIEKEENEMELIVKTPTFPEIIEFNFDELKQEITNKTSHYMNLVYTEDQIQEAKKDVATLRKFTKALSDERIKVKKECLKPYEDFESKIKELDGIVNKAILNIDGQVKASQEKDKEKKQTEIETYFENTRLFDWLNLQQIFNEKWLNASVNIKTVCAEIDSVFEQIKKDLDTLSNLPEFSFEAIEEYKQSLDINKAITEGQRMSEIQKRKAEEQQKMNEAIENVSNAAKSAAEGIKKAVDSMNDIQTQKQWISFKALLSTEDALALKSFFESRNVEFMPL